uniref:Uncharacterized protein n=1 Tax=Daphnia galeata TaxID=27404 RepID=A0A8J2RKR7_9CRUS|nr:unnamed protein product [Daphnia galeata]
MDETGVTTAMTPDTVMTPEKIVGRRGQKQIGAIISAERGTLVTVVCRVSVALHPQLTSFPEFGFPGLDFAEQTGHPPPLFLDYKLKLVVTGTATSFGGIFSHQRSEM